MGEVEVVGVPPISSPDPSALARAGGKLAWRRWM
jgi:hypothetical protein